MSQPLNQQVGKQLVTRRPPKFAGHTVVGGTWKPTNLLKNEPTENEDEEIFNYSFYSPGEEVKCQMVQHADPPSADLQPSQVLDEVATDENPDPGSWVVIEANPTGFGLRKLMFDVTLRRHDALDLTEVS